MMLNRKFIDAWVFFAITLFGLETKTVNSQDLTPSTSVTKGAYSVVTLQLSNGLAGEPQVVRLTFRGDRCVNFWFLDQGVERINLLESSVVIKSDSVSGELRLRLCPQTTKREHFGFAKLRFDLKRTDGQLSGRFDASTGPGLPDRHSPIKKRSWKGEVRGAFVSTFDKVRDGKGWPDYYGPHGNMSATHGPALIDDLNNARPVWQSEAQIPVSYGNAPDSRYFWRAAGAGSGGGACSPVVADGKVFIAYHRPSKSSTPQLENPFWQRKYPNEKAWLDEVKQMQMLPREQDLLKAHFKPHADDVLVAIDAASGATLWTTAFPMRSHNLQTHKHRGLSGVPLVSKGTVFYPNLHGRLYAVDTETGKVKWEWPQFTGPPETKHRAKGPQNPSPVLLNNTLVWMKGKTYGLDPSTGMEKWTNDFSGYAMRPWHHVGKDYVLANSAKGNACIDVATGNTIWKNETVLGFSQGYGNQSHSEAIIDGDILVSFRKLGEKKPHQYRVSGWQISLQGLKQVWEDEPMVPDENLSIAVHGGVAYCIGKHLVRCLDVKTGKHLGSIEENDFGEENHLRPRSNAWLTIIGDRLFLSPEGQHGKHGFMWFESDPKRLKQLGDFWVPPHHTTTAYNGQPIIYPVVDGRIFMRGGDAIYCYDLRKQ